MANTKLARTLRNARWVCEPCGISYGDYRARSSTFHLGTCDVCKGQTVVLTEVRDFGYLRRGLLEAQDNSLSNS
jgi:hypothetical protein